MVKSGYKDLVTTIIVLLIMVSRVVVDFRLNGLIGYHLGPETYGNYTVAITTFSFFGQLLTVGLDSIFIKYIPLLFQNKEYTKAKFYTVMILQLIMLIAVVWLLIAVVINIVAHRLIHNTFLANYIHPSFFFLGCAVVWGFFNLGLKMLRGLDYKIINALIVQFSSVFLLIIIIMLKHLSFREAILITTFDMAVSSLIMAWFVFNTFKAFEILRSKFPDKVFTEAINYIVQQVLGFPISGMLLIVVEASSNVPENDVGIVAAVFMIPQLLWVVQIAIRTVFARKLTLAQHYKKAEIKHLLTIVRVITTSIMIILVILIYCFSSEIISVFGNKFAHVQNLIPYGLMASIPSAVTIGEVIFINYSDHNKSYSYVMLGRVVFAIIVGVLAVQYWSMIGAIITLIIEEVLAAIVIYGYTWWILHKHYK